MQGREQPAVRRGAWSTALCTGRGVTLGWSLSEIINGVRGVLIRAKLFEMKWNFSWLKAARFGSG